MADDKEIGVKITAKSEGLTAGLAQATSGIKSAVTQMEGHFSGLGGMVNNLKAPFMALSGLLVGGAIFKESVDATKAWTGEAMKLSRALGITTEQASVLNVALGDIYSSTEEYLHAVGMLNRQLARGGEVFEKYGIQTKDAAGNLRPMGDLMQDTLQKLREMATAQDRNVAGTQLFGRGWGEAAKMLRLNAEVMKDAQAKAEKLNLIVGGDMVEAQKQYKAAMNDVGDVMTAVKVAVGKELLPVLTELAQWFAEVAPPVITVVSIAMKALVTVFEGVKLTVQMLWIILRTGFQNMADSAVSAGQAVKKAFSGDFKGAIETIGASMDRQAARSKAAMSEIADAAVKSNKRIKEIWEGKEVKAKAPAFGEGRAIDGKEKDPEGRLKLWQAELRQLQDHEAKKYREQGKWYEMTLTEELRFWQRKLQQQDLSEKERVALIVRTKDIERAIRKEAFEVELSELQYAQDRARNDLEEKRQLVAKEVALYRDGTKEQVEARRKLAEVEREIAEQRVRIEANHMDTIRQFTLNDLNAQKEILAHRVTMGELTVEQQIEQERDLLQQRMAVEREYLLWQRDNQAKTEEERKALNNRIYLLDQELNLALAENSRQLAAQQKQAMETFWEPVKSGFQEAIQGLLSASQSWGQAWKGFLANLGRYFDQMIAKMVVSWVTGENTKTMATQWAVMKRIALESWAAVKSVALAVWAGLKWIVIKGYEAAAGAFSAIASIPYVGPFLAPVAAGVALAAVLGMASKISSAAGGWGRVPGDQLAQVHKDEMVIPAHYAEGLRNMLEGGEAGGRAPINITINASAMDARGMDRILQENAGRIADLVAQQARYGRFSGRGTP